MRMEVTDVSRYLEEIVLVSESNRRLSAMEVASRFVARCRERRSRTDYQG